MISCERGNPRLSRALIRAGADVKLNNFVRFRYSGCCSCMDAALATLALRFDGFGNRSQKGLTALHYAAARGVDEVCTSLLDAGADPNVRCSPSARCWAHILARGAEFCRSEAVLGVRESLGTTTFVCLECWCR
jgi:ankyrin repeat protein